jgi:hypothetical protein
MILKVGAQPIDSLKPDHSNPLDDNSQKVVKSPAIKNLVGKVLGPMIDSYFQVSAQGYDALDFFNKTGEIQSNAADYIREALNSYGVQSIQTLITDIDLPDELEALLRDRQILQQKAENYKQEELTEEVRQSLIKQQEINKAQANFIKAQQNLEITNFNAQATLLEAQANAQIQQINNQVDLERQQQELNMKAAYDKQLKDISINEFAEKVKILSPEIYAQLESDGKWAEAYANTQITLPETFISSGGGSDNSSGGGIVEASAMQMAFLEILREKSKRRNDQIGMSREHEALPPADDP